MGGGLDEGGRGGGGGGVVVVATSIGPAFASDPDVRRPGDAGDDRGRLLPGA